MFNRAPVTTERENLENRGCDSLLLQKLELQEVGRNDQLTLKSVTNRQIGVENVRAGVYGDSFAVPAGYFGH